MEYSLIRRKWNSFWLESNLMGEKTGEIKGKSKEIEGEVKGKVKEVEGEIKGKTKEVEGKIKGKLSKD